MEKIIGKRKNTKGQPEYKIKWKGYSMNQCTWEPESHLSKCRGMIVDYEKQVSQATKNNALQKSVATKTAKVR